MTKDLLGQSMEFIGDNILDIILVVLIIFLSISYMIVNGIKIEKTHPKLRKVVIFENMDNIKNFCKHTNSMNNPDLNCKKLDKETCKNDTTCCLYDVSKETCVSATNGKHTNHNLGIDEWYYLGKLKKIDEKN